LFIYLNFYYLFFFKDFGAGLDEIAVALKDCNAEEIVNDIRKIAQELSSGTSG
jgi:hypothetical protein